MVGVAPPLVHKGATKCYYSASLFGLLDLSRYQGNVPAQPPMKATRCPANASRPKAKITPNSIEPSQSSIFRYLGEGVPGYFPYFPQLWVRLRRFLRSLRHGFIRPAAGKCQPLGGTTRGSSLPVCCSDSPSTTPRRPLIRRDNAQEVVNILIILSLVDRDERYPSLWRPRPPYPIRGCARKRKRPVAGSQEGNTRWERTDGGDQGTLLQESRTER